VRFWIKEQLEHPGLVTEHHALCQLRIFRGSHFVGILFAVSVSSVWPTMETSGMVQIP
jgi:hypothetical protein